MGQELRVSCRCGYKKDVQVGSGLLSIQEATIRGLFTPEELADFDKALKAGEAGLFIHTQKIAHCRVCADLFSVPELSYGPDEQKKHVIKPCPDCGGQLVSRDSAGDCPKCGSELSTAEANSLWD